MKNITKISAILLFTTPHLATHGMELKIKNPEVHHAVNKIIANINNPQKRAESRLRRVQKKNNELYGSEDKEKAVANPCPICHGELDNVPTITTDCNKKIHGHCFYSWLAANRELLGSQKITDEKIETPCILCRQHMTLSSSTLKKQFLSHIKKGLKNLSFQLFSLPYLSPDTAKPIALAYENATSQEQEAIFENLWRPLANTPEECAATFKAIIALLSERSAGRLYAQLFPILGNTALDGCTVALINRLKKPAALIKALAGIHEIETALLLDQQILPGAKAHLYFYTIWKNRPLFELLMDKLKIDALNAILQQQYSEKIRRLCFTDILMMLNNKEQQRLLIAQYEEMFTPEFIRGLGKQLALT